MERYLFEQRCARSATAREGGREKGRGGNFGSIQSSGRLNRRRGASFPSRLAMALKTPRRATRLAVDELVLDRVLTRQGTRAEARLEPTQARAAHLSPPGRG